MKTMSRSVSFAGSVAAAALLTACAAVGPNYSGPPSAAPVSTAAGRFHRGQAAAAPTPTPSRWWTALGDPELNQLEARALAGNPNLREAQDRLRSARAALGESRTQLLPSGGASAADIGAHVPLGSLGGLTGAAQTVDTNLWTAGVDATWELDVFGGTRRAIEAAADQAGAEGANLDDARVEIAADVARAYVNLRDVQARLALARQAVSLEQQTLALTQQRRDRGVAADGDIERVQTALEQAQAEVPTLEGQVEQYTDQLSVLTGQAPGALDAELAAAAPVPTPPAEVAVGDPAALLRHRPDIRVAERQLAARNAQIGQHVADLFPSVSLFGVIGFSSTDLGRVFEGNSLAALGGPQLTWNILKYPQIEAQIRGAKADRDAAADHYVATVQSALEDAEGSLSRFGHQRLSLVSLAEAESSADRAADLTRRRYQGGTASLIDVLDAQRQEVAARQATAQGRAALTGDFIALQKSLGLGWEDPPQLASAR